MSVRFGSVVSVPIKPQNVILVVHFGNKSSLIYITHSLTFKIAHYIAPQNVGAVHFFQGAKEVIKACSGLGSSNPSCCSSLNTYIATIQKQMLITNKQDINCAFTFGSILQKGGVMANVYELCDIDLKDFSLQVILKLTTLILTHFADLEFHD